MTAFFAILGLAASAWLTVFQLALTLGAPLGEMAWGGQSKGRLPAGKRLGSAASFVLMAVFCSAFGQAAELWAVWPEGWLTPFFFLGAALFALSVVGNAVSKSRIERLHGVPLTVIMVCSCLWMALFA